MTGGAPAPVGEQEKGGGEQEGKGERLPPRGLTTHKPC